MDTLKSRQNGFSLVELMLAMTLSLFLIAGLFISVIGDLKSYESIRATEMLLSKSRMSLKTVRLYLQQTGFRNLSNLMINRELQAENTTDWQWDEGQRLQGINAPDATEILTGAKEGSDIVALRFIGVTSGASSSDLLDCNGSAVTTDDDEYEISLYISTADQLICKDATGTIVLDDEVEHLHIMYGFDDETTYKYYDADNVSDWSSVNRIKVALLLTQRIAANNVINNNDYQLFDRTISAANDTNFRQVVSDTILIRNEGG